MAKLAKSFRSTKLGLVEGAFKATVLLDGPHAIPLQHYANRHREVVGYLVEEEYGLNRYRTSRGQPTLTISISRHVGE